VGSSAEASRLDRLRKAIDRANLKGLIIVPGPNSRYLTGVNSMLLERPFMLFVPSEGEVHLVAPELESGPYRSCPVPMRIHSWTDSSGSAGAIRDAVKGLGGRGRWGLDGRLPFRFFLPLRKQFDVEFVDGEPVMRSLREVKDSTEVKLLRESMKRLSASFLGFPGLMDAGITELDLAKRVSDLIYSKGAMPGIELIVQSGVRTADPHGLASRKKIARGEPVILDLASTYDGYYADITRTFCIGKSPEVEKVYEHVLEANLKACRKVREGVQVGEVDAAAREHLKKVGLEKYFTHRTGHGLGLEVHEPPYIIEGGKERLSNDMFFTVEPGAYLPGKFGVRIEDNVTVTKGDGVVLTDPPKEYGWWT
jgi:Xaa-Pro dipeptidase